MSAHRERASGAQITNHDLDRILTRGFRRALVALTGGAIALIASATAAHAASPPHHGKPPPKPPAATATAPHGHGYVPPLGTGAPGSTGDSGVASTPPAPTAPAATLGATSMPTTSTPAATPPTSTPTQPPSTTETTAPPTGRATSTPPTSTPPASAPATSTPPTSTPPASTPPTSAPTTSTTTTSTPPTTAAPTPAQVGDGSTNSAAVNQSPVVVADNEQPIVITGGSGTTKVTVELGGTVETTITATATNSSDGAGHVSTAVAVSSSGSVTVTNNDPVTDADTPAGASPPPATSATIAIGNGSTNVVLVTQSPSITVIQNIPIVLDHPSGDVTINAVIDGMVITNVTGTASNTSNGSAQLSGGMAPGTAVVGNPSAIPSLSGNHSVNTVVVIQTPTITVICTIPIVVIDPQGPVTIHAAIAGVVVTNITANAVNASDGNATLKADSGGSNGAAANLAGNDSTNTIEMVQAPTITVLQSIPITVVEPDAPVSISASIGGSVTTTVNGNAVNMSNGQAVVVVGSSSGSGSKAEGRAASSAHNVAVANESTNDIELTENPQVIVTSDIPVSLTDPHGLVSIHKTMGTIVITQVHSAVQNVSAGVATFMMRGDTPGAGNSGGTGGTGGTGGNSSTGSSGSAGGTGSTGKTGRTGDTGEPAPKSSGGLHDPSAALPPTALHASNAPQASAPISTEATTSQNVGSTPTVAITVRSAAGTHGPRATGEIGAAPPTAIGSLAYTGSGSSDSIPLGVTLAGGGLVLVELARRRRRHP